MHELSLWVRQRRPRKNVPSRAPPIGFGCVRGDVDRRGGGAGEWWVGLSRCSGSEDGEGHENRRSPHAGSYQIGRPCKITASPICLTIGRVSVCTCLPASKRAASSKQGYLYHQTTRTKAQPQREAINERTNPEITVDS
eukprot:scaffold101850_cov53-Phaeocystis_antarctica.AAC.1